MNIQKLFKENRFLFVVESFTFLLSLLYFLFISPPGAFPDNFIADIPEGAHVGSIGEYLKEEEVIRSSFMFKLIAKVGGKEGAIISGSYYFKNSENLFSVFGRLTRGESGLFPTRVTIFEGYTNYEIARELDKLFPRIDPVRFLKRAEAKEGRLFPDTYFFLPNADEDDVINAMYENFEKKIEEIGEDIKESQHNFNDILIMASILEKEAHDTETRKKIAGVLWKRLDAGMPLQVDATLTYVVGRNTFNLTQDDLNFDSPYNTYKYPGLPPGPIANPGLDAILSAIYYKDTPYWFYLADRAGTTYFSETFEEHVEKKRKYLN
jgi:UPF0755 protein